MSEDDAKRIIGGCSDVKSPEELLERFLHRINISESHKVYVRSVSMDADRKHATGVKGEKRYVITTPQWTFFDGDWWQTDD